MVTSISHKRIVGYVRVSTEGQARVNNSSLETQEERIRTEADLRGGLVIKLFRDIESGRRDDRPEYRRMLRYVIDEGADAVLVQYLDRFGRNPQEILSRIWELKGHGVSVEATDQDITDELMLMVSAGVAGHESKRISERVRANMGNSARKGIHSGKAPYGFRPIREIKDGKAVVAHWEIEESESAIIREMARLSVEENLGFKAIADTLNERGMTRNSRPWVPSSIQMILRNPVIKGLMVFGRSRLKEDPSAELIEVPGVFPPILNEEEWDALQLRMDIRKGAPRGSVHTSVFLLSGIARCGHCGGPMTGKTGAKYKGKSYRSYQCVNAKKARALCAHHNSHVSTKLEPAVLEYLGRFSNPKRVAELLHVSGTADTDRKKKELRRLEKQLSALDTDFQKNLEYLKKEILTEEEFSKANQLRRDERAATEIRIAELREQVGSAESSQGFVESLPSRIESFIETFEKLEVPKAKAILQMILKAAYVKDDNGIELEFR